MKRLLLRQSRLRRRLFASWQPVDVTSPDLVQVITDAMAMGSQIQIEYQGSGWRLIQPYGWNSSHAGNVLLMCYKDTGEIRSYRLDRVLQVLVDDSLLMNQSAPDTIHDDGVFQTQPYGGEERANPADFEIPLLPNIDEVLRDSENEPGMELPYEEALDVLTDGLPPEVPETPADELDEPIDEVDEPKEEVVDEPPTEEEEKLDGK